MRTMSENKYLIAANKGNEEKKNYRFHNKENTAYAIKIINIIRATFRNLIYPYIAAGWTLLLPNPLTIATIVKIRA